jgi:hypothetical protein
MARGRGDPEERRGCDEADATSTILGPARCALEGPGPLGTAVGEPLTPERPPGGLVVSPGALVAGLFDAVELAAAVASWGTAGAALLVRCEPNGEAEAVSEGPPGVVGAAPPAGGDGFDTDVLVAPPPRGSVLVALTALGGNGGGLPAPKVQASTLPGGGS